MNIIPATPDNRHPGGVPMGRPAHMSNPKSTARRGTRRLNRRVKALLPPAVGGQTALDLLSNGHVDPASGIVVWLVNGKAVEQAISEFRIPDLYEVQPVRRIGSYRRARNRPGWYPVMRGDDVIFIEAESRLEMHWFRSFDMEPGVTWMQSQPFVIYWPVGQKAIRRIPDLVVLKHGAPVVVEVRPDDEVDAYTTAMFALTEAALKGAHAGFRHGGSVTKQSETNHHAVSGCKRPHPGLVDQIDRVLKVEPETVRHLFTLCGDVGSGIAVLFHLRANGRVLFNMDEPIRESMRLRWTDAPA